MAFSQQWHLVHKRIFFSFLAAFSVDFLFLSDVGDRNLLTCFAGLFRFLEVEDRGSSTIRLDSDEHHIHRFLSFLRRERQEPFHGHQPTSATKKDWHSNTIGSRMSCLSTSPAGVGTHLDVDFGTHDSHSALITRSGLTVAGFFHFWR